MKKRRISTTDYHQLVSLREMAILHAETPHQIEQFYHQLLDAELSGQEQISEQVITMNSRVCLKETSLGKLLKLTLAYPEDANPNEFKVSVFSSIGMALIGRTVGDHVSWKIHNLTAHFLVDEVIHQPEAVADFNLNV